MRLSAEYFRLALELEAIGYAGGTNINVTEARVRDSRFGESM